MLIGFIRAIEKIDNSRADTFIPLSFAYLASYLEKYGNYTDFIIEDDIDVLISKKPDIIGISSYTENYNEAILYAKKIKKILDIPIILGASHITGFPQSFNPVFSVGVIGEGEQTFLELVNLVKNNSFDKKYFSKIKGLVYFDQNKIIFTEPREIIKNIDDIPPPKLELLEKFISKGASYSIHTSRGCPYKCIFCSPAGSTIKTRYHSPERIMIDLDNISKVKKENDSSIIYITDDLFAINKERLGKIVKAIKEHGFEKQFQFICHGRADIFSKNIAKLLKEMNTIYVSFGFESGSDEVLKYLKTTSCSISKHYEVLDICKEFNIGVGSYFIAGSPMETKEDLAKTYWFIFNNRNYINLFAITKLTPLPNSILWNEFINSKNFTKNNFDNFEWDKLDTSIENNNYFFLPKKYDKDFFEEARKSFIDLEFNLNIKNSSLLQKNGFLGNKDYPQFEGQSFYQKIIYNFLNNLIPKDIKTLLEVNQYNLDIEKYIKNIEISHIKPNDVFANIEKTFDMIIFNHSLEQVVNYERYFDEVSKNLKKNGYYIFLIYNIQFIENLLDIIFDAWDSNSYGIRQVYNYNYFSLQTFLSFIKNKNLKIEKLIKYKMFSNKYENDILENVKKILNLGEHVDYFNYIILCKPK